MAKVLLKDRGLTVAYEPVPDKQADGRKLKIISIRMQVCSDKVPRKNSSPCVGSPLVRLEGMGVRYKAKSLMTHICRTVNGRYPRLKRSLRSYPQLFVPELSPEDKYRLLKQASI